MKMLFLGVLSCLFILTCVHQRVASPGDNSRTFETFVVSTEMEIGKAWPILSQAPKGLYISIGSERSFRGASMADADGLLILDISPEILRFSNINRVLLKAKNLKQYRQLRFLAPFSEWQTYSLSMEDYDWWVKNVRNTEGDTYPYPELFNQKEKFVKRPGRDVACFEAWEANPEAALDYGSIIDFRTGNYLFNEELFNRLHKLAIQGRIDTVQVDLADNKALQELVSKLKSSKKEIGVIDFDNLYSTYYIGEKKYRVVVDSFLKVGSDQTILLVMTVYKHIGCIDFQEYFGFRFGFVKQWPKNFELTKYLLSLPFNLLSHMSGKLYSQEQLPPFWNSWQQHMPTIPEVIYDKKFIDSLQKK